MSNVHPNASDIEAAFAAAVDERCTFGKILGNTEPEVRKIIQSKVDDELRYSAAVIARVLKGLGFPTVSDKAINMHRRGTCRCPNKAAV